MRGGTALVGALCAAGIAMACPRALALDAALDVDQYAHTAWRIREGFFRSNVDSFAQTPDGYLWMGTEFGLLRFDGVRSVPWQPPAGSSLPDSQVRVLLTARNGSLWIGTATGLASWDGHALTTYPELAGRYANGLVEDREGTIWVATSRLPPEIGVLCAIRAGHASCEGQDGSLGESVSCVYEDRTGRLWVATKRGLWRWRPGSPTLYSPSVANVTDQCLSEDADGAILLSTRDGLIRIVDGRVETIPLPAPGSQSPWKRMMRDRDGALWIATSDAGLLHVHRGRTDVFTGSDGLSGKLVRRLFEDREGNIWVATVEGLDRFRAFAVTTVSDKQGLSNPFVGSVLAARDGTLWLGTVGGLNHWDHGQVTAYGEQGERMASRPPPARTQQPSGLREHVPWASAATLFQDDAGRIWIGNRDGVGYLDHDRFVALAGLPAGYVDAITEDNQANVWIAHREAGLLRWSADRGLERLRSSQPGRTEPPFRLAVDPVRGGLWLGYVGGGVSYFEDGRVRASYAPAEGLAKGRVDQLRVERDGTLWVAANGGLSRLKNGRVATLSSKNGLPCDSVDWMIEDDAHDYWIRTACGLVRIAGSELGAWVASVDRGEARQPPLSVAVFDSADGVTDASSVATFTPHVAKSADGRLWFATQDGLSFVDPRHLLRNTLRPPVHIEQVIADRKPYAPNPDAAVLLRLPPLVRDLEIDYTALSFAAPEKVRFRYRLEGHDGAWQDVGTRRQAFYTDLAPGDYRFHVIAANNSGVWNEAGASVAFSVAPAYYQTAWFRASTAALACVTLWVAYRWRVRALAERLQERQRAAEALELSEERYELAVAGSNEGIFDWDLREDRLYLAPRTQELLGLQVGEAWRLRREWQRELPLHPDDVGALRRSLRAHLSGRTPDYDVEFRFLGSAEARWLRQRGVALRDAQGRAYRMAGSIGDVTDRKRAAEEMQRLQARLQQSQRFEALGSLAGGIAHDFNNILQAILAYGQRARQRMEGGAALHHDLDTVIAAGERGRALVDRITAFSRGSVEAHATVHVESVVREALRLIEGRLPAGTTLAARLQAGRAALIGDATQVHQVVMNLATNAVQAMHAGGTLSVSLVLETCNVARPASVGTIHAGEWLVLEVADTGGGIAPEILGRIFDPFFTTKEIGIGTGLGLSLVLRIVTQMGGAIDVSSTPGRGSVFTVYLPRAGDAPAEVSPSQGALPRGAGQRVMTVDDDDLLLQLMKETIDELGYVAVGFLSSVVALDAFRTDPQAFDVLVTDEHMSAMSGEALIGEVRRLRPALPVILVGGTAGHVPHPHLSVSAILQKPVSESDLAAALAAALAGNEDQAPTKR